MSKPWEIKQKSISPYQHPCISCTGNNFANTCCGMEVSKLQQGWTTYFWIPRRTIDVYWAYQHTRASEFMFLVYLIGLTCSLLWVMHGWLLPIAIVVFALWPIFLGIVIIILLLGLAIHPKSLLDFGLFSMMLSRRYIGIPSSWPRTEWISIINKKTLCHSASVFGLFHPVIRSAWLKGHFALLFHQSIPRSQIRSIRIELEELHQPILLEHMKGIEEIGIDLSLANKQLLLHYLIEWWHIGRILKLSSVENNSQQTP